VKDPIHSSMFGMGCCVQCGYVFLVHNVEEDPLKIHPLKFTGIVFEVSSSSFLLNATIRHNLECYRDSHPDLIQLLLDSFYVDDLTTGADSKEEAHSM